MCGGVNRGENNPVPVALLRNPQADEHPVLATFGSEPESPHPQGETKPPVRKARKLWELKRSLYCPVIGTCLDIDAWRRLARARGFAVEDMSDYEVHIHFVGACGERNASSLAAQKALDRAHQSLLRRFARARSREDLEALWQQVLDEGEVPGGFWALVTHPLSDAGLTNRAYEDIHMLSHQIGAGQRADLKKLQYTRVALERLRKESSEQQNRHLQALEQRDRRLATLQDRLASVQEELRVAKAREAELTTRLGRFEDTPLEARLTDMEKRARAAERDAERLQSEATMWKEACELVSERSDTWERELLEQRAQREALERLVIPSASGCDGCSAAEALACPNLCGRRILCVGGRSHVIEHYREIVARCNGEFDHHDGGIEDKPQRLNAMLSSADVVICTIDCVSHDAYNRSKRFCKRSAKPCVLLRSSGVSTFARALEQVAGGDGTGQHAEQERGSSESMSPVVVLENPRSGQD
jgi:hypothetical protein